LKSQKARHIGGPLPDPDRPDLGPDNKDAIDATRDGALGAWPRATSSVADIDESVPARIGRYTIVRLLGEGGMGAVYEAEQVLPHRTVALKLIRAGYAGTETLRRFENEAQALGRLQHPGIAQIYEAGMLARKDRIDVPDQYHLELARRWLVQLYQTWGKPDKAAEWKNK